MFDLDSILNQVKETNNKQVEAATSGTYKEDERLLRPKIGHTYYLRLLSESPKKVGKINVTLPWKEYAFTSRVDGSYQYLGRALMDASPSDTDKDLVRKAQIDAYTLAKKNEDADLKKAANGLWPKGKEIINVYVHNVEGDDEKEKEKIGKVFGWKYNASVDNKTGAPRGDIYEVLVEALSGAKSGKIGKKAFDLSENGRSVCLKVTGQPMPGNKMIPKYAVSFEDAEDIGVPANKEMSIREMAHDLSEFVPAVKSQDDIKKILDQHWYGTSASPDDEIDTTTSPSIDKDDDIPMGNTEDSEEFDELDELMKA